VPSSLWAAADTGGGEGAGAVFGFLHFLQLWFLAKLYSPQEQDQSPGFEGGILDLAEAEESEEERPATRDGTVLQLLQHWLRAKFK